MHYYFEIWLKNFFEQDVKVEYWVSFLFFVSLQWYPVAHKHHGSLLFQMVMLNHLGLEVVVVHSFFGREKVFWLKGGSLAFISYFGCMMTISLPFTFLYHYWIMFPRQRVVKESMFPIVEFIDYDCIHISLNFFTQWNTFVMRMHYDQMIIASGV